MSDTYNGLQALLPPHSSLIPDEETRTLHLLLTDTQGQPRSLAQSRFTVNEWRIMTLLLQAYPKYVPHETQQAAFREIPLSTSRQQLAVAKQNRALRQELKAIRNVIDHIDAKLSTFHFTLLPIHKRGYTLALLSEINGDSPFSSVM